MRAGGVGVILACCVLAPVAALAQADAESLAANPRWQFAITVNAYLPQISGTAYFPAAQAGAVFTLHQSDPIDHLKMTLMGAFDAHRGP